MPYADAGQWSAFFFAWVFVWFCAEIVTRELGQMDDPSRPFDAKALIAAQSITPRVI